MARITAFCSSPAYCNTYVVDDGEQALLFDAGSDAKAALSFLTRHNLRLEAAFLTHGHYDHIAGLADVDIKGRSFPIFIGADDERCLYDDKYSLAYSMFNERKRFDVACLPLDDEDEIKLPHFFVKALATPYHTLGSMCFLLPTERMLFTGDSLFHLGIGRSDLPGAAGSLADSSLRKILALDDDLRFYPGHGSGAKLGEEKRLNPYLTALKVG